MENIELTLPEFAVFANITTTRARDIYKDITREERIAKGLTISEDKLRKAVPEVDFDLRKEYFRTLHFSPDRLAVALRDKKNIQDIDLVGKWSFLKDFLPREVYEKRVLNALAYKHCFLYCGKAKTKRYKEFIESRKEVKFV